MLITKMKQLQWKFWFQKIVQNFKVNEKWTRKNKMSKQSLTIGLYPAPVVAAIGCGVQPVEPGLAAFFGEFQFTPLHQFQAIGSDIFKIKKNRNIYLTCADADLFIVKFSANDANELSKSPVSTLPVLAGCGTICGCPPPVARIFPCWMGPPVDEAGFNTSPNASKPLFFWFFFCADGLDVMCTYFPE